MAGSEIVTLFGNELPEIGGPTLGLGHKVIGGQKVSYRDLSGMLLTLSVVNLALAGAATIEATREKKLFRTVDVLTVRASGQGEGFDELVAGVARSGVHVSQLAVNLIGRVASPDSVLISKAESYFEPYGAVVASGGGAKLMGALAGAKHYDIVDAQAQQWRPHWDLQKQRWETWKASNPALAPMLVKQAKDSVGEAKAQQDTGADF